MRVNDLKTYKEWKEEYEKNNKIKIVDDDGLRKLCREGNEDSLMSFPEAFNYLILCTIMSDPKYHPGKDKQNTFWRRQ